MSDLGDFDGGFDSGFDHGPGVEPPAPALPKVRLVMPLDAVVDDHVRPKHPLWRRYFYPPTQRAVLLWQDGRTLETGYPTDQAWFDADYVAAGGIDSQFYEDDWQVAVLEAAGYTLEAVPS